MATTVEPLPAIVVEPIVRAALAEDLGGSGDITSAAVVPASATLRCAVRARKPGVVAGVEAAALAFRLMDPALDVRVTAADGTPIEPGDTVLEVAGPARAMLSAERVALNLLCHLSGVATATAGLVAAVGGHKARITCTRKTTPGLRPLEKHAVRAGGGVNHRYGLDDGVLIKDNHIAAAGGIEAAVARARAAVGHMVTIEIEVDTLAQLSDAIEAGPDAVLLDNMTPGQLADAVAMVAGRLVTEASGTVTAETVPAIAAAGVDYISSGWITHSAPSLDLGLDVVG